MSPQAAFNPAWKQQRPPQAWRMVNGPLRLAKVIGEWPDLTPYTFAVRFSGLGLGPALNVQASATLDSDADFYVMATSAAGWDPGDPIEDFGGVPRISPMNFHADLDVWEEQGGARLSNVAVPIGAMFGRGDRPFVFPYPWRLSAGSRVTIRQRSRGLGVLINATILYCFHGVKMSRRHGQELPVDWLPEPRLVETLRRYRNREGTRHVAPYFLTLYTGHDPLGLETDFIPQATEAPTAAVADADFIATAAMWELFDGGDGAWVQTDTGTGPLPGAAPHLIRLVLDEGKTRLDDRPQAAINVTGHGKRWFRFPSPLIVRRGQTVSAIVTPQRRPITPQTRWLGHLTLAGVRMWR